MITRKEWFTYQEIPDSKQVIIVPKNYDTFPMNTRNGGSYAVAPARVLGLTYPDYLRFLTTMFPNDMEIRGKGHLYPIAYWIKNQNLYAFIRLLNLKLSLAVGIQND